MSPLQRLLRAKTLKKAAAMREAAKLPPAPVLTPVLELRARDRAA